MRVQKGMQQISFLGKTLRLQIYAFLTYFYYKNFIFRQKKQKLRPPVRCCHMVTRTVVLVRVVIFC